MSRPVIIGKPLEPGLKGVIKEFMSYKSGVAGLVILCFLIALSVYTAIAIPWGEAIERWRVGEMQWIEYPRNAQPIWVKYLTGRNLPETIRLDSRDGGPDVVKAVATIPGTNMRRILLELYFEYDYDDFPSEVNLFLYTEACESPPIIDVYWVKPNGNEILLITHTIKKPEDILFITADLEVEKALLRHAASVAGGIKDYVPPKIVLFAVDDETLSSMRTARVLKSTRSPPKRYILRLEGTLFGLESDLEAKLVVYGTVYGLAGTDHLRRDLTLALLWGTPIALAFGLTMSLTLSVTQLILATVSGWYGGIVDSIIQRLTEVYMVIPTLPFLILVATFYRVNIWMLVLVIWALSIFGAGIKNTRALVMQIKHEPYVEAALAYGASSRRIILFYIIPKILPPMVPGLIGAIPGFVFLEAGLAFLGLGDPYLPTWGKILNEARAYGAVYKGYWWWIILPSAALMITGIVFALIGFALDRIVNPKLREIG